MRSVELSIGGMTCASCAARIEKKLNRLDGVQASVNYATSLAAVTVDGEVEDGRLVATVTGLGYTAAPRRRLDASPEVDRPSLWRLALCGVLALPVLLLSMVSPWQFTGWGWVALALTTPVVTWGAWPFHRATWTNARHGASTMDTLVSLGVSAAYLWSLVALVSGHGALYLDSAAVVTAFLLVGRYAEARAKHRSGEALRALLSLGAKDVSVLRDGVEVRLPVSSLTVGEQFVVRAGEKIATDGEVVDGASAVDESMLTGESVPVEVSAGSSVTGGCVNAGGRLVVRATRIGADTQLAQLGRLVEQAQNGKAAVQRLGDRVSAVFVPAVLVAAVVTFGAWLALDGSARSAFTAAVAVLIVACPCALGLATPTALLVGTGRGAQLGIVVRGPATLESTRRVDTVLLDKTGTVTTGAMTLHSVIGSDAASVLRLAGAVEAGSSHPVAAAIVAAAGGVPPVTDFAEHAGLGVSGFVEGHRVAVGRGSLVDGAVPADVSNALDSAEAAGRTAVLVSVDGSIAGALIVADTVRPTSPEAVAGLRRLGLHPVLLTGDNPRAARAVADAVGISEVVAGVLPAAKLEEVRRRQAAGAVVAMVGDGVNDAAALAAADLGIAIGTGTDVAVEASDLTLMRGDLLLGVTAVRLARATLRTIKENLFWAFAYNVAALPLAAFGLLNPMIAGLAMACSSVLVVTNSLRLRRFR